MMGMKLYAKTLKYSNSSGQVLTQLLFRIKGENFDYYIKLAGGTKKEADRSKIYVLQPNGVSLRRKNGFKIPVLPFMPFERDDILPGGTLSSAKTSKAA